MSDVKMISPAVKNVPWQDKPEGLKGAPIWRYTENPIIGRNPIEGVARIFNSAVMPYEGEFIGVFRGEQTNGIPYIYIGILKRIRLTLWMKAESRLCLYMHMTHDL